jgi:TPR repeat protein
VKYSENEADVVSMTSVVRRNNNYERLKQYTADDEILKKADKVASSQDELLELLDNGEKEIYLCGDYFVIPGDIENVKYIGVNAPRAGIHGETIKEGIEIKNVICDVSGYVEKMSCFKRAFQNNPQLGFSILEENMKRSKECPRYYKALAWCYEQGFGTDKNDERAHEYYHQFAEIDAAEGAYYLACYYKNRNNYKEAGNWFLKSASNGFLASITAIGGFYYRGYVLKQDYNKAVVMWKEAASRGDAIAMCNLACRCFDGKGIEIDKSRGIELFRKSYENGYQDAMSSLLHYAPEEVGINEALLYVLGGKDNMYDKIVLLEKRENQCGCLDTMLITVRNITKIHVRALAEMAAHYRADSSMNITFLGDGDNAKKMEEDVVIVLDELQLLDDALKSVLENEFTVEKIDDMSSTQDYLKVKGVGDILQKLKNESISIGSCKTFQGAVHLISGKNQIESYLGGGIFTK